jgi:tetratricopeptide (TPR) repeat protein
VTITPQEETQLMSTRPVNTEAYEAYLMGRYFWNKGSGEGFKKAIDRFEQAIELDPTYGPAYAWLADACAMSTRFRTIPLRQANAKAKAAAVRALELDGGLARAHVALGDVNLFYERDWPVAEANFKRAIELDPKEPRAHQAYAVGLTLLGRFDEAMHHIQQARELDPISLEATSTAALILYFARRYDEAIAQARKALELDPNYPPAHRFLGRASLEKGLNDDAIAAFQKGIVAGGPALLRADLGHAYARSGRRGQAMKILNELLDSSKEHDGGKFDVALLYVGLGDRDRALEWLEKSVAERERTLGSLQVSPVFDPLRSDPRFHALLRRVGLWPQPQPAEVGPRPRPSQGM